MFVIGFELIRKGKAGDIAQLLEHSAQHTLGQSIASVSNSVCSDAVAMAVGNDDEVFPGGVTSELCLMHQAMKMGQTGVGQLERTKMKVIQNEFVEGKKLYNMVHRLASFFSYSDSLRELHVHCGTTKCVKIRLKLDVNTTRVTVIWALLMSVLRMKSVCYLHRFPDNYSERARLGPPGLHRHVYLRSCFEHHSCHHYFGTVRATL